MNKEIDRIKRLIDPNYDFDELEYEKQHILRLAKSVEMAILNLNPKFYPNLKRTVYKYLCSHEASKNLEEYKVLFLAYKKISENT